MGLDYLMRKYIFSWQDKIKKIKLFKYYTEKDNKDIGHNCHH